MSIIDDRDKIKNYVNHNYVNRYGVDHSIAYQIKAKKSQSRTKGPKIACMPICCQGYYRYSQGPERP